MVLYESYFAFVKFLLVSPAVFLAAQHNSYLIIRMNMEQNKLFYFVIVGSTFNVYIHRILAQGIQTNYKPMLYKVERQYPQHHSALHFKWHISGDLC